MQLRSTPRKRIFLRGFAFGLLSLLALVSWGLSPAPRSESTRVTCQRNAFSAAVHHYAAVEMMKIGAPADFSIALEDSDELFRVEMQPRTFGSDREMIESKVASNVAPRRQAKISPPLLV